MIDSLLAKITGLWDKNFLFGSFLPAIIFGLCAAITFAYVLGLASIWSWVDTLTLYQRTAYFAFGTLFLIVFAYILNALRMTFRWFWSGNFIPPLRGLQVLLEGLSRIRYRKLSNRAAAWSPWKKVLAKFEDEIRPKYKRADAAHPAIDHANLQQLINQTKGWRRQMGQDRVTLALKTIVNSYDRYEGNSLGEVFRAVKVKLIEWNETENNWIRSSGIKLDRHFGSFATIRATRLGNVLEAHNQYCYKRYNIEPEIFWPRLRGAIRAEDKYLELIDEPVILLDFALTMASLSATYAALALVVGPWLWYNPVLWLVLCGVGIFITWQFYEVAVGAARQSGELTRATFDLFRLRMMTALGRPSPTNLESERRQWEELSLLAASARVESESKYQLEICHEPPH